MARVLKKSLGDKLYTTPADPNMTSLPSPEKLKGKILIKVMVILRITKNANGFCFTEYLMGCDGLDGTSCMGLQQPLSHKANGIPFTFSVWLRAVY